MRLRLLFLLILVGLMVSLLSAQRVVGLDTLYGNEWIRQGQDYLKLAATEEGFFEVTQADLASMGWGSFSGADLKLTSYGEEQALWVSNESTWSTGDKLIFYSDPTSARNYEVSHYSDVAETDLLNPKKRVYSDSLYYYLSVEPGSRLRYSETTMVTGGVPETTGIFTSVPTLQPTVYTKVTDQFGGSFSSFRAKEGYSFGATSRRNLTFLTRNAVDSISPKLTVRTLASNAVNHRLYVFTEGDTLYSQRVSRSAFTTLELDVPVNKLQSGNAVTTTIGGALSSADRFAVGLAELSYTKTLTYVASDTVNRFEAWRDNLGGQWSFQGLPAGVPMVSLNIDKGVISFSSSDVGSLYNQAEVGDKLAFTLESQLRRPTISNVGFGNLLNTSSNYFIITSKELDRWSRNPQDWATYRSSLAGGSYETSVVYVEDLYEQFGYGEPRNAAAIQAAISFLYKQRGDPPHVLLLGKGREFQLVRFPNQRADVANATNYVPTIGKPGADNLLAFNPLNKKVTAYLGRIAVGSEDQLVIALEKVRQADDIINLPQTLEDRAWTKKLIHLVGGGNPSEQAQFKVGMDNAAKIFEQSNFGAFSVSFYKQSNTPIQSADNDALFGVINDGARQLTFLGHGSQSTLDFNVDNPNRYNNAGRLPVFFALGCLTGNVHTPGMSIGERFLLEQESNSLAFGASTGLGYPSILLQFIRSYYTNIGTTYYGESIGKSLAVSYQPFFSSPSGLQNQFAEQFTLQGDPALKLSVGASPDYVIDPDSIRVVDGSLVATEDSLTLQFLLRNLGSSARDTVLVKLERETPNLARYTVDTIELIVLSGSASGVAKFQISSEGGGLNNLYFTILDNGKQGPLPAAIMNDALAQVSIFIADNSLSLTYPSMGASLKDNQIVCYGQAGGVWDGPRTVEWELSTESSFTSPQTIRSSQESTSLIGWDVTPYLQAGETYFVRLRSTSIDSIWQSTYFTWNPQHNTSGYQLSSKDAFNTSTDNTLYPRNDGAWSFSRFELSKSIRNKEYVASDAPSFVTNYDGPAGSIRPWVYLPSGVAILIGDSITSAERFNQAPGQFGSINGGGFNRAFMYPANTQTNRDLAAKLIDSVAQNGDFIYFFTCFRPGQELEIDSWFLDTAAAGEKTLIQLLQEQGASKLDVWRDRGTVPYTLIFQKGMSLMAEDVGENRDDVIQTEVFLNLQRTAGVYQSIDLPPLANLDTFSWELDPPTVTDTSTISIVRLIGDLSTGDTIHLVASSLANSSVDLSNVSTSQFEALRFEVEQSSPVLRQPLQIRSLELSGDFLPEVVFDPAFAQVSPADTIELGEPLKYELGLRNLAEGTVAQQVVLTLSDLTTQENYVLDTVATLAYNSPISWAKSVSFNATGGAKELFFQAQLATSRREIDALNSVAFSQTFVNADGVAPILKIFADGEPLRNNDLLSPIPEFIIEARDYGNQYSLGNTGSLAIRLSTPDGRQLSGADLPGTVTLLQNSSHNQRAQWSFEPGNLPSGVYKIAAVVEDIAGNSSNTFDTDLSFEIENSRTISRVLPYPNPMVDRVKFQYELTGSVPEDYQIDIYSVSGRLVRSLGPQELGPLKIGRRLTDLAWNGTTEIGEKLAAGTYLYRFSVSGNDKAEAFDTRETTMDQYVKSGFGKLVILP